MSANPEGSGEQLLIFVILSPLISKKSLSSLCVMLLDSLRGGSGSVEVNHLSWTLVNQYNGWNVEVDQSFASKILNWLFN
ncbi:hypothetical protein NEF87_005076 [Candidatus Lokiarchaeum ossiferum]|uniref:Uncharacterized protein n=1 Tax=Candidatus Lokiarchaeum ossiferum TaxID=2951803 RepID=A0ABY6HZ42_9ARCH|nr:hypothetical protein NEF87_003332 [Candidatus Lokiarchaeum sp. B-35]UYP47416.1 hypothetical protein NEF87_003701 [Candidatus Lokiarchaeum sp. B-35]UYP48791.1 hypothetical protein NEF87_005076 [Candidatus Lokiarchaeum sp. B-35]